jgi:uncharacterized protein (DUF2461 family)
LKRRNFKILFPEIHGDSLKTTPKGYPKDHPEIELLKRKQLFFLHRFTDKEVASKDFGDMVVNAISALKPFTDYMNYVLYEQPAEH